jgi:hypothetical protein
MNMKSVFFFCVGLGFELRDCAWKPMLYSSRHASNLSGYFGDEASDCLPGLTSSLNSPKLS